MKADLKIDWATHEAAKYAVEHWHYSKILPMGKLVKFGVWEGGKFVGVVLYGRGASPHISKTHGLEQTEFCELVRVALTDHVTPVSKIVAITLRMLKKTFPTVKLVVSFADKDQNHHGGIYQAGNWIYTGIGVEGMKVFHIHGKPMASRTFGAKGYRQDLEWIRKNVDPFAKMKVSEGKHRYFFPLDEEVKKRILPLAKPYPKRTRGSSIDKTSSIPEEKDGSSPISALHSTTEKDPTE